MAEANNNRINFLIVLFFLISVAILGRMFSWQITKHSVYAALAEGQRSFLDTLFPDRGEIFINDRSDAALAAGGVPYFPVAINKPGYSVYAVPAKVKDPRAVASALAKILGKSESEIMEQLSKKKDYYEVIQRKISEDKVSEIKALKLEGVEFEPETWRYWPENSLMAQVLGFVGFSGDKREGQYGIEGYYNSELEGKKGIIEIEQDSRGKWISLGMKQYEPATDGSDIVLTVDRAIQYKVEQELSQKSQELKAKSAQAIVMEPATGKILAMANWPGYDPNNYSAVTDYEIFTNKNIQSRYEPGSIIKAFTLAAALNEKKITPDTTYEDPGSLVIDGWRISNYDGKGHGVQTMTQVLEKSLNTGAIFAADKVGRESLHSYFKNFGFNTLTGIELKGEISGDLGNMDTKSNVAHANASFGQGIAMTPLEAAVGFSSLVNGGKLMKPYIVDKIIKEDGTVEQTYPEEVRTVITPETSAKITSMLVSVVENGFNKKAKVNGYWIGGKTGTAQVSFANKRGYSDKTIHTFVGFGPAPAPKFLILVKIDEPEGVKYAEYSALPVFNNIAKFLVNYMEIPPDRK